ncbi:MAG: hypothetical protein KM310_08460 [Clostridiales bacterium]|nr:hypothetical protein [Clostridiales bacterium]
MSRLTLTFDHFPDYEELTRWLQRAHDQYPDLTELYSIGRTYEGREIWCLEITQKATGPGLEKPGMYVDANIHASEFTGGMAALETIRVLLEEYPRDPLVRHLVDTRVFYILPRISADGSEMVLKTPYYVRSNVRPYPEEEREGLYPEDINGDGLILTMRVKDPNGAWRKSAKDPRVMVRRGIDEVEGEFYHLYVEGRIRGPYEGGPFPSGGNRFKLDLNRNFPGDYRPEGIQPGASLYPLDQPETRAMAEFFAAHPNIACAQTFHTFSGVILRPYATRPDKEIPGEDLRWFEILGQRGKEITGYPMVSVYEGFRFDKASPVYGYGTLFEWWYGQQGVFYLATELWNPYEAAGVTGPFSGHRELTEEDWLKMMEWNDKELKGEGFVDWQPFQHPDLGEVEIGGWKTLYCISNAPFGRYLKEHAQRNARFNLTHAAMSPRLAIARASAKPVGDGVFEVWADVQNQGYLPTYVTRQALQMKAVKEVEAFLEAEGDIEVLTRPATQTLGHISGRGLPPQFFRPGSLETPSEKRVRFLVKAPRGGEVTVVVRHARAGTARARVQLPPF